MKSLLLGIGATLFFASNAHAATLIYDEADPVNGDLSGDNLNPTVVNLSVGSNQISGSTTGNPNLDRDFFTFTIPVGRQLSQVILTNYVGLDGTGANQGFLAVQRGSSITSLTNNPPLLGAALIGAAPGTLQGDNVLDDVGTATSIQGSNFVGFRSGRLGAGTYTFWIQETAGGIQNYTLDFVTTVPEPSTILGIGAVMGLGTLIKRKKRGQRATVDQ
ncbi:PEP-CTERM sorting domain-containing protein [Nostoc sp. MBR 210]|uniref:PEP-CTERM sorting domain-containing protein n=1 Tax=Nostoc spongiaeforme FACHB-130 TaxID=1357510 RepID=A0ABR8G308_9NOSO|nr:PEP-CTERM sorting domain-containing protein [Nostoc spongiaeforme]MBD2597554.1 PEP-CTERM sorting domain-containing protein [Nostoc spongiaeforme FACHB-130]OCQ96908.1 PEP-CTERM sorting domain-containing protein [Nostoc sp. MBR 210]